MGTDDFNGSARDQFNITQEAVEAYARTSQDKIKLIKAIREGGRPNEFTVEYGETYAEFRRYGHIWRDSGNGCRGVNRDAVVNALTIEVNRT